MNQITHPPTLHRWNRTSEETSSDVEIAGSRMSTGKRVVIIVFTMVAALLSIAWIGLQIEPEPFALYSPRTAEIHTVPLPDSLPPPVRRFYRDLFPNGVPVITSAVITGRATMQVKGVAFPARFRFTHDAGRGYRHYIEATWFGATVMKVNEHYLDGRSRLDLPSGVVESSPRVDQAANLGMWAESVWLPSIWITDPRVRWTPFDENSALLHIPFNGSTEHFVVSFDPKTGMLVRMHTMRYKEASSESRTLWLAESREWRSINGHRIAAVGSATWMDDGTPWATFTVEDIVYNVDVSAYVRADGQ